MRGRRKLPYTRIAVSFGLPEDLVREFDAYCEKFDIAKVNVVEVALRRYLETVRNPPTNVVPARDGTAK